MSDPTPSGEATGGSPVPRPRVARPVAVVVTDDSAWASRTTEIVQSLPGIVEVWAWSDASGLPGPGDALLLHVDAPHCRHDVLRRWAERAWQPTSLVSLEPNKGAGDCGSVLQELGYGGFLQPTGRDTYWDAMRSGLTAIIDSAARLVPVVTTALDTNDIAIIDILTAAAMMIPVEKTVSSWARNLGISGTQRLDERFVELHLPSPKRVLDTLRLLQVVEYAKRSPERLARNELARLFNYSSGDYLGKRARELAGHTFGELRGMELSKIAFRCLTAPSN